MTYDPRRPGQDAGTAQNGGPIAGVPGKQTLIGAMAAGTSSPSVPGKQTLIGATTAHDATAAHDAGPDHAGGATPGHSAIQRAMSLAVIGTNHLSAIESTLLPAYRKAVTAMDVGAVRELATHIVGGIAQIREAQATIGHLVPQADPHAPKVSTPESDPFDPDAAELGTLIGLKSMLDVSFRTQYPLIAIAVSPQRFGDEMVGGSLEAPPPTGRPVDYIAYEASQVIELLEEANTIASLVAPEDAAAKTSVPANDRDLADAVGRLEQHKGRPINFMFLVRVLKARGVWPALQAARNSSGHTGADLEKKETAQAKETGLTPDVGTWWDADDAHSALTYGATDWAVTDQNAMDVFDMLAKAEPRARAGVIKQLNRRGLLGRLCNNLPWGLVKQLWESIDDDEAKALLVPYWEGKGGGKSLGQMLRGSKWTSWLDKPLDYATFGAKRGIDNAHEQREGGLISDDAYWWSVDKSVARAGLVGAAAVATGGVAGEFAGGIADGLEVGAGGTAVIEGATAGSVGSVGGHLTGDVYDQALNDKQGFDSFSDYAKDFAVGGMVGAVVAPVGMAAAKYLPEASRTMAQQAAAQDSTMARVMEGARGVGKGAAVRIRMTVREVIDTFRNGSGPPGMSLAFAGASGTIEQLATAPPDAGVWVTVRPLDDLNAPKAMGTKDDGKGAGGPPELVEVVAIDPEVEVAPDATQVEEGQPSPVPAAEIGAVRPSLDPDPMAEPGGTPAKISPRADKATARALTRQNEVAKVLSKKGYKIEQNREVSNQPGKKQPDYTIEGEPFDAYSPTTSNAFNIVETMRSKQGTAQADRFVLDLTDSGVAEQDLLAVLNETPIDGLRQIIVVRGSDAFDLWP
jgi:hypothetical protein